MALLYNLARMTTATTGTGTITLGSAVSGYLTFAQAGVSNGDVVSYGIKDGSNSEVGTGTYTTAGTTLTRTVTKSTNSNTAISLSGTAEVFITPRAEDFPFLTSAVTNSLSSDVTLSNTSIYFAGPTVAQGTTGTWFASGTVTISGPGTDNFECRLWDGTTVIASAFQTVPVANFIVPVSLSGFITSPAGNIRIDCKDISSSSGKMYYNATGDAKDCTLTAFRIK